MSHDKVDLVGQIFGNVNPFEYFWTRGYYGLWPAKPGTKIPAIAITDFLGEVTGWQMRGARKLVASTATIAEWGRWPGVSVSFHCENLVAIDIDVTDELLAQAIESLAFEKFGTAPRREGNSPKRLLLYRPKGNVRHRSDLYRRKGDPHGPTFYIEVLAGRGHHFIAGGIHPTTGKPYAWTRALRHYDDLMAISEEQVDAFFAEIEEKAVIERIRGHGGSDSVDREKVDQDTLLAPSREAVEKIVAALPNRIRDYHYWVKVVAAIRGALGDVDGNDDLGLELFEDFSERLEEALPNGQGTEHATRVYTSLDPPFGLGFGWLVDEALAKGGNIGPVFFEEVAEDAVNDWVWSPQEREREATKVRKLQDYSYEELVSMPIGNDNFLIEGLLDRGTMSLVYGDSNSGKTFVALDIGFHIATGMKYDGKDVHKGGVIYLGGEGARGISKRIKALEQRYQVGKVDMCFVLSPVDLRKPTGDLQPLLEKLKAVGFKIDLIIVDTLARAMAGGNENAGEDMSLIIRSSNILQEAFDAHAMWIHHVGKDFNRGARGHSSLRAALDTEILVTAGRDGNAGTIGVTKQRDIDGGWKRGFGLRVENLTVGRNGQPITSCTIDLMATPVVEVKRPAGRRPEKSLQVLSLVRANQGIKRASLVAKIGGEAGAAIKIIDRLSGGGKIENRDGKWFITQQGISLLSGWGVTSSDYYDEGDDETHSSFLG